jgi:hypothetical protein
VAATGSYSKTRFAGSLSLLLMHCRRQQLQQLLLSPITNASCGPAGDALCNSSNTSSSDAPKHTLRMHRAQQLLQAWRQALTDNRKQQQQQPQMPEVPHGSLQQQSKDQTALPHNSSSRCEVTSLTAGFADAASVADVDLPLAALQQLELLLSCDAPQLLQLCFPGLLSNKEQPSQQQQQQQGEDQQVSRSPARQATAAAVAAAVANAAGNTAAGSANAAAAAAPVACAVADALDTMSSAGVELLTASLKRGVHLAAAQQQQQGEAAQHVACSHWLAQQWTAAATATSSSQPGSVFDTSGGQQRVPDTQQGGSCGVAHLPAVAKKLLLAVTACIKLLREE